MRGAVGYRESDSPDCLTSCTSTTEYCERDRYLAESNFGCMKFRQLAVGEDARVGVLAQ